MLKNISKLGKTLSKTEQKEINGGFLREKPFIGSGCRPTCPSVCLALGGVCVDCTPEFGGNNGRWQECRIF